MEYKRAPSASPPGSDQSLLRKLKEHVVQTEAMVAYVLLSVVLLYLIDNIDVVLPVWLVPSALLVGLRAVVRVTNPTSAVRNALVWAGVFGGVLGGAVGAATDVLAGGLTGGQGTLIGIGAGSSAGAALGNWIESWGKKDKMVERGEAFSLLYSFRKKNPRLSNPKLIDDVLDYDIKYFDINDDGRKWYAYGDLIEYAKIRRYVKRRRGA